MQAKATMILIRGTRFGKYLASACCMFFLNSLPFPSYSILKQSNRGTFKCTIAEVVAALRTSLFPTARLFPSKKLVALARNEKLITF